MLVSVSELVATAPFQSLQRKGTLRMQFILSQGEYLRSEGDVRRDMR